MKKFLSKVLTLALVCVIAVTSTSITSEAKSTKAATTTYSSNAVINDFIATGIKSNGLVINGKSYDTEQLAKLGMAGDSAVTTSPLFELYTADGTAVNSYGDVYSTNSGRAWGFVLDDTDGIGIYIAAMTEYELAQMEAFGYTDFWEQARLSTNGVWNTDAFTANNINTQYISSWMQSRGLNTASDIYNYLVANGATFTVDTRFISDTEQFFVCVQCSNLWYSIDTANGGTRIWYNNEDLSGVSIVDVSSGIDIDGALVTDWYSSVQH